MDDRTRQMVRDAISLGDRHGMAHLGQIDSMLEKPDLSPADLEVLASWLERGAMLLRYHAKRGTGRRVSVIRRLA
jgi:hypothetical protein